MRLTPAAFAATETFTADLKAASEVPANDSKGSGMLNATYDTATKKLTYTVTYKDLSGPADGVLSSGSLYACMFFTGLILLERRHLLR